MLQLLFVTVKGIVQTKLKIHSFSVQRRIFEVKTIGKLCLHIRKVKCVQLCVSLFQNN